MALRLDVANPLANFSQEGGQSFTAGAGTLSLNDAAITDIVNFFGADADAAAGGELDLVANFRVVAASLSNADSGVHLTINDGASKAVIAAMVVVGGVKGIGIAGGSSFSDPANYPVFVPVDWSAPTTVRLRRTAAGDGEIIEVNGIAPSPRALLVNALLAPRNRVGATVEFGCTSPEATANVDFTQLFSEKTVVAAPGTLTFTQLRINDADRLRIRGDYTFPAGGTASIDPATEAVSLKLSTPAGGQFYPSPDFNPVNGFTVKGQAPRRRWEITAAEKTRTGLERLDIDEDPSGAGGTFVRDPGPALAAIDFTTVNVELTIGDDVFSGVASMVQKPAGSGKWRLASEP